MIYFHKGDFLNEKDEVIGGQSDGTEFYYHMLCYVVDALKDLSADYDLHDIDREYEDAKIALHHLKRKLEEKRIGETGYKIGDVRYQG